MVCEFEGSGMPLGDVWRSGRRCDSCACGPEDGGILREVVWGGDAVCGVGGGAVPKVVFHWLKRKSA